MSMKEKYSPEAWGKVTVLFILIRCRNCSLRKVNDNDTKNKSWDTFLTLKVIGVSLRGI